MGGCDLIKLGKNSVFSDQGGHSTLLVCRAKCHQCLFFCCKADSNRTSGHRIIPSCLCDLIKLGKNSVFSDQGGRPTLLICRAKCHQCLFRKGSVTRMEQVNIELYPLVLAFFGGCDQGGAKVSFLESTLGDRSETWGGPSSRLAFFRW